MKSNENITSPVHTNSSSKKMYWNSMIDKEFISHFSGTIYEGTSNIQLNTIAKCIEQELHWGILSVGCGAHKCEELIRYNRYLLRRPRFKVTPAACHRHG